MGVSPYHFNRSGCAGDHCLHECPYDTHCVQVTADTSWLDLTSVHNTLGPVAFTDETRAATMRAGSCGGGGDFGMRCSGEIVRTVGDTERTPESVRAWDANVLEFRTDANGGWVSNWQVTDAQRNASLESWWGKGQPQPAPDSIGRLHVGSVIPSSVVEAEGAIETVFSAYNQNLNRMAECQVKYSTSQPLHPPSSSALWGSTTDTVPTRSTLLVRGCVRWG